MLIEVAQWLADRVDVVIVLADEDGDPTRMEAPDRAVEHLRRHGGPVAVFGVCNPIAEAWMVALLAPSRPDRCRALNAELGFRADRAPEQLAARPTTSERHAKRALNYLLDEGRRSIGTYPASTPRRSETEPALRALSLRLGDLRPLTGCGLGGFVQRLERDLAPRLG